MVSDEKDCSRRDRDIRRAVADAEPVLVGTLADRFSPDVPAATQVTIVACAVILQIVMLRKRGLDSVTAKTAEHE